MSAPRLGFARFFTDNYQDVCINPYHVSALRNDGNHTYIFVLGSDDPFTVDEDLDAAICKLYDAAGVVAGVE